MTVNLATIPESYWRAWLAGYSDGVQYGYVRALADVEADDDAAWAELSQRVRKQANSPRFSQLSDTREDRDRAEIARAHERRTGLELAG